MVFLIIRIIFFIFAVEFDLLTNFDYIMNEQVRIKVERETACPTAPRRKVFEQVVECAVGLSVPYDQIVSSLQFIYGFDSIVTFELSGYGK